MKRFIIVSMSLMCLVPALAQEEFESLLSESKVWTMMIKPSVNPEEYGDLCYIHETKLMGDTIINDIHFMRKYERQCKQGEEMPAAWSATNEYLGQDGSKIYLYSSWSKKMILDMDLSLKVGDKIGYYDLMDKDDDPDVLFYFVVTAVSDTIIGGSTDQKSRRCVYVQVKGIPSLTDVWIEGIGSMQKGISGVWLTMAAGSFEQMMKCTDGDAVLYQSDASYVAQDTLLPMVVEGRIWNVVTIQPADPSEAKDGYYDILRRRGRVWNRKSYIIEGDTVIGGVTYKKLLSDGKFVCGMREEEGRVYRHGWGWNPDSEALVYDFNAKLGDIFKNDDEDMMVQVKRVSQVNINGQNRRCLEMHHYDVDEKGEGYDGGFADYWIEGIGCTGSPHHPFWWDVIGNYPLLLSCYDGEECVFNIEDFNGIVTAIKDTPEAVHRRSVNFDTPIYDLSGQKVKASYKGVVIQNGKKYLQK